MSRHQGIVTKTDVKFDQANGSRAIVYVLTETNCPPPEPDSLVTVIIGPEPETVELCEFECDGRHPASGTEAFLKIESFDEPGKWRITATRIE